MKKKYFGTDGIRGKFNSFPITQSFIFKLALAISRSKKNIKKVIIGRDTRISGQIIEDSLYSGFKRMNVQCHFMGIVSTPILSFYTKKDSYDYGLMISASHNPYSDNGIKIFKKNGEKLNDKEELEIESILEKIQDDVPLLKNPKKKIKKDLSHYDKFLKKKFSKLKNIKLKVLIDCANGSLSNFGPKFFRDIGAELITYGCKPNGKNINKFCGATFPERLSKLTQKNKVDIGISFDGDADRVIICDENGKILDGDLMLAVISKFQDQLFKNNYRSIVSTKMCSLSFRDFINISGLKLHVADVGDKNVIEKMKKTKSPLGGEPSGHIVFSENGFCGDGLLTALILINIAHLNKLKISYFSENFFKKNPQELLNIKLKCEPKKVLKNKQLQNFISQTLLTNPEVDILLRKSGTENLLRVMVQSKSQVIVNKIKTKITNLITKIDG